MLHRPLEAHSRYRESARIGFVSTYAPSRCGIARFTSSLVRALERVAPNFDIPVARLVESDDHRLRSSADSAVAMEFDPNCAVSVRAAARHLGRTDLVVIQHEYGIFGEADGSAVMDLVDQIRVPIVSILHTVLTEPSRRQREIVEHLAAAGGIVVPSESARDVLETGYDVNPTEISMIPHGCAWSAAPPTQTPRRRLISWGLLGPGKGIERAITAVAALSHLEPHIHYQIVGQTHPKVLRSHGQTYRESLEQLARDLSIEDLVEFIDRYVADDELYELISAADIVLAPYDNSEQISSGVLTDALAAGRPVVATRFPHAVELLENGAGIVVDHDSVGDMAQAISSLLEDTDAYAHAAAAARSMSDEMSWDTVGASYATLFSTTLRKDLVTA